MGRIRGRCHRRPPRLPARLVLALLLAVQVVAFGAVPASAAEKGFTIDLAAKGDFVAQTNFVQCVGASMQMMLNIIGPTDDRTAKTQLRLQNLARTLSGPTREGFERKGASVRGWSAGLNRARRRAVPPRRRRRRSTRRCASRPPRSARPTGPSDCSSGAAGTPG